MTIELATPDLDELDAVYRALGDWQIEGATMQLHPGDLGWFQRDGADAAAAAMRTWSRDGRLLAAGMLDGPDVLRLAVDPELQHDATLAQQVVADVTDPARGALPAGRMAIESWPSTAIKDLLSEHGWKPDEPWAPLRLGLADPVQVPDVRTVVVDGADSQRIADRTAVHRAAFNKPTFTDERWHVMAEGAAYRDARCLVAYTPDDAPAAAITVWSAGAGRPGLIEPLGADPDHRGKGYGRAVTLAGAAALRELGSSSVVVATPASNTGGVAAYVSAGFEALPLVHDRYREA